jgi:CheY-like chemotaxis protein
MTTKPAIDLPLKGARILIVEDEWLICMLMADLLTEFGCHVVGPASTVAEAAVLASTEAIDAALLDINLNGEEVYPVARILADRGIPFVFLTGYRGAKINEAYRERPVLQKPARIENVVKVLKELVTLSVK